MYHLYLGNLSRNKGMGGLIAERSVAKLVESAPCPCNIICHNCVRPGHFQSRYTVAAKGNDKRSNGNPGKSGNHGLP